MNSVRPTGNSIRILGLIEQMEIPLYDAFSDGQDVRCRVCATGTVCTLAGATRSGKAGVAIDVSRRVTSEDVMERLSDLFINRGR